MGKGPEWAKVNLAPEKLEQIRRLIELDEQLLFRCGGRPLVVIPPRSRSGGPRGREQGWRRQGPARQGRQSARCRKEAGSAPEESGGPAGQSTGQRRCQGDAAGEDGAAAGSYIGAGQGG